MSNSSLLKSSIAKKYWMALTGLFLCLFLVGHLLGNLQLILNTGEEGRRAFNEYAYFMGHNIFIKVLSYLTYASIIFHAVDGIWLTIQNRKARPVGYKYSNPSANSSFSSRWMAILGSLILVFLVTHMANFWWKMKISEEIPLHTYYSNEEADTVFFTHSGKTHTVSEIRRYGYNDGTEIKMTADKYNKSIDEEVNLQIEMAQRQGISVDIKEVNDYKNQRYAKFDGEVLDEGYMDLHTVVMQFFKEETNPRALLYLILYVFSMAVLGFHLWHGFASAFQSLGVNHRKYTPLIKTFGYGFAVIVPLLFAIIPIIIFMN